jgi:hypothetical protein
MFSLGDPEMSSWLSSTQPSEPRVNTFCLQGVAVSVKDWLVFLKGSQGAGVVPNDIPCQERSTREQEEEMAGS